MKILNMIKKIIVAILLIIFFAITITLTIFLLNFNKFGVTQFDETSLLIIKKSFSSETYKRGSLVFVESKNIKDYKKGEEAFVYHLDGHGGVSIQIGTIENVHEEENAITFSNGATFSDEFIMGTGTKVYPKVGRILSIVESKWGFLFLILVPNFFLFVYQLYSLIVEIKYGKDE